ncbi:MAG: amino acid adenylation domain-containing protein [Pseudobutyrivibrio sp.]|nr:amino acid adenylation domain-containing protein [Pseudobutyrivibrio sp.]
MKYTVIDYFEETVEKYGSKTAFADVDKSITFAELKKQSQIFATSIIQKAPQVKVVAFYMDKCVETIVGFLGSVYAGNAYTQINLKFPESRVQEILKTVEPTVIVTDKEHFDIVSATYGSLCQVLLYEDMVNNKINEHSLANRRSKMFDMQPLYINFTSGSTGVPKGVAVGHRSVIDFITAFTEIFEITSEDSIMNQAPFDFDVSVKDIYSGLFTGATVNIIPTEYFVNPTALMDYICDRKGTVMIWAVSALCFITSMNALMYRVPDTLRIIMFSGEIMPIKHLNKLKKYLPEVTYVNLYGPTEITCNCTYYILDREFEKGDRLPIGVPFPNERIYILDDDNNLITESGKKGELCVSGTALALGYYRNKEKTDEAFVQNPNNKDFIEMMYRTGDIVEIGEDGQTYYVSRKDSQIKHMGHRIEMAEIELAMEAVEGLNRACCYFDEAKDKIIAIYIGTVDKSVIIDNIEKKLPYYMIPNIFYQSDRDQVPMNKNGKVDRKLLFEEYSNNK